MARNRHKRTIPMVPQMPSRRERAVKNLAKLTVFIVVLTDFVVAVATLLERLTALTARLIAALARLFGVA